MPMNPMVIRSLGAGRLPRPSADAGTMMGSAAAALKPFRKLRRLTDMEFIALLVPEYNKPLVILLFTANIPGVLP